MKTDLILDFIISGNFSNIKFGVTTTRLTLSDMFDNMKGLDKKNRIFEILKHESIYFYMGVGARGSLEGIKVTDILSLQISIEQIEKVLLQNNISIIMNKDKLRYTLSNSIQLFFYFNEDNKSLYLDTIIKANTKVAEEKLLNV